MADDKKICNVSMDNAENGVIVSYTEKRKSANKGTFDNCDYEYCKEVFPEDKMEAGFTRFKELFLQARDADKD